MIHDLIDGNQLHYCWMLTSFWNKYYLPTGSIPRMICASGSLLNCGFVINTTSALYLQSYYMHVGPETLNRKAVEIKVSSKTNVLQHREFVRKAHHDLTCIADLVPPKSRSIDRAPMHVVWLITRDSCCGHNSGKAAVVVVLNSARTARYWKKRFEGSTWQIFSIGRCR